MTATEYQKLTEAVGFLRLETRELVQVSGADSFTFLHKMTTNDFESLASGAGCEAFATNAQGKIQGFFSAWRRDNATWLEMASGAADGLIAHLDMYVIREDVKFEKLSDSLGMIALVGEGLAELAAAEGWQVPELAWSHVDQELAGEKVTVVRCPWLGTSAIQIVGLPESLEEIEGYLAERVPKCDPGWASVLRVENGYPDFGTDVTSQNLPQELSRDAASISFTKGCYIGQETVARIHSLGHVNKLLRQVQFSTNDTPPAGTELRMGDKVVGQVSSIVDSPRVASPLALAIVRREACAPGTELDSNAGSAVVVDLTKSND